MWQFSTFAAPRVKIAKWPLSQRDEANKKSKEQKQKQKTSNDATSSHDSLQQANLRKVSLPAYYIHNNQPRFSTTPGHRSVRLSVIIMARLPFPGAYDCLASIRKGLVFGNEATVAEATLFGSFQKQKQQCNSPNPFQRHKR